MHVRNEKLVKYATKSEGNKKLGKSGSSWEYNNKRVILKRTRRCGLDSGGLGKDSVACPREQKKRNFFFHLKFMKSVNG
jgi:hypothetical protein